MTSNGAYDDGLYALCLLFAGGIALATVTSALGAATLLVGFPVVVALAAGAEAFGRWRGARRARAGVAYR